MKPKCAQAVSRALGRGIDRVEAQAIKAHLLRALRQDVRDRATWDARSPAERVMAAAGRLAQEATARAVAARAALDGGGRRFNQLAGAHSKTIDPTELWRAQEMDAAGASEKEIWLETGWWKNPEDGKWRYEIDDSAAAFRPVLADAGPQRFKGRLADLIDFPELFAAYPAIADLHVRARLDPLSGARGAYVVYEGGERLSVTAPDADAALGALLHEIQHVIQGIEGFEGGGSPESARGAEYAHGYQVQRDRTMAAAAEELAAKGLTFEAVSVRHPEIYAQMMRVIDEDAAIKTYLRIAGEMEARNVENRRGQGLGSKGNKNLSPSARRATPPSATFDLPLSEAVFALEDGQNVVALRSVAGAALGPRPGADAGPRAASGARRQESRRPRKGVGDGGGLADLIARALAPDRENGGRSSKLGDNDRGLAERGAALARGDPRFVDSAAGRSARPDLAGTVTERALALMDDPVPWRSAYLGESFAKSLLRYASFGDRERFQRLVTHVAGESPLAVVTTARAIAKGNAMLAARADDFLNVNDADAAHTFLETEAMNALIPRRNLDAFLKQRGLVKRNIAPVPLAEIERQLDVGGEQAADRYIAYQRTLGGRATIPPGNGYTSVREDGLQQRAGLDGSGPRGETFIPEDGVFSDPGVIVSLFETADRSTPFHEFGHVFLEMLHAYGARENAPAALLDDLAIVRRWLGAEDGVALTTEQHEQFARGFEAYLREGRAPQAELQSIFDAFKSWLLAIYRSIADLDVELDDDIRGVFDRLVKDPDDGARNPAVERSERAAGGPAERGSAGPGDGRGDAPADRGSGQAGGSDPAGAPAERDAVSRATPAGKLPPRLLARDPDLKAIADELAETRAEIDALERQGQVSAADAAAARADLEEIEKASARPELLKAAAFCLMHGARVNAGEI